MSAGVHALARSGRVTQRCHNRNPRWETGLGSANDVTYRKRAEDLGRFEKGQLVELSPASGEDGWLSGLAEAWRIRAPHELGGGRWKRQNRRNVYLSPYVEEPLHSKVIKSFEPELRSRKRFSCFEIPMFYVYKLWTFYVRFTHIRIMGMVDNQYIDKSARIVF